MKQIDKRHTAIAALMKELETILAPLIPTEPYPGVVLEPDFRRMVIPSPSPVLVEAAIDAVTDYTIRQELTTRMRRLEADLTNFDCNKRRFHEECKNVRVAHERQANGTLSDAPEALKQVRRNLKGDIVRLKEIIDGTAREQTPVNAVIVGPQAEQLANVSARKVKELKGKSAGGRKGAAIAKAERGEDTVRKAILDDAKNLLKEWDERYPNRHKQPRDEQHSDAAAFRIVANRHRGADGKPIMSADTIGRTLRRKRAKNEKRGNYPRTGKKRGKYKPRT